MTAQGSVKSGAFYKFLPYYLTKLRYLKPQIIMNSIFALLSYPLFLGFLNGYCAAEIDSKNLQSLDSVSAMTMDAGKDAVRTMESLTVAGAIIGAVCLVGLFAFTFVTTLRGFRYLYDKSAVDMDYSLPVNHNTRFFADLSAVLTSSILPHLISVLVGLILIQGVLGQAGSLAPEYLPRFERLASVGTQCMFTGIFACVMQIGFTLLMISVCGKKAEAGLYPVLLNIAVPVIHVLCVSIVELSVYGASGSFNFISAVSTSPVGMIVMTIWEAIRCTSSSIIFDMSSEAADAITMPVYQPIYGIIALLLTLAFLAGAYFLIKHRRTERVGMPYVYKGMGLIIPGVIIFTIALPICNVIFAVFRNYGTVTADSYTPNPAGLIAGLLISTFIVYVIMELISGRAFRRFHITVAKWAGTVAVCAGISAVLTYSNGFGLAYYVPDPGSVERASISIHGLDPDAEFQLDNYYFGFGLSYDPEAIKAVAEVHKLVPKDGKPVNYLGTGYWYWDTGDYGWIEIMYKLKNGGEVGRVYPIESDEELEKYLRAAISPDTWYEMCIGDSISEMSVKPEETEVTYVEESDSEIRLYQANGLSISISELAEVIKQDSQKAAYELAGENQSVYRLKLDYRSKNSSDYNGGILNARVYSWMDSTIKYLEECGLNFDYSQYRTAYLLKSSDGERIYDIMPEAIMALDEGITSEEFEEKYGFGFKDANMNYSFVKLDMDSVGFKELMESTSNRVLVNKYCILLMAAESCDDYITNDNRSNILGVPDESIDLAEKLFSQGQSISAA